MQVLSRRLDELASAIPAELERRVRTRSDLKRQVFNLSDALAEGGRHSKALIESLNIREVELEKVEAELRETKALTRKSLKMPDQIWIDGQLEDLADLLKDDVRHSALLLRQLLGRVASHEISIPGKKRGYIQLRFRVYGGQLADRILQNADDIPLGLLQANSICLTASGDVTIDLGAPSRMDKWAPKIDRMRREGVPWNKIGAVTGLGTGNAYTAWKRYHDAVNDDTSSST